jgi:glycosyltransferase involved in cell wall biosynthesis
LSAIRLGVTRGPASACGIRDYAERQAAALPADLEVRWVDLPAPGEARAYREAARRERDVDVVHVHYEYGLFEPVKPWRNRLAAFLRALECPAVVTLHGELPVLHPRWQAAAPYRFRDALRDAAYLPFFAGWERRIHGHAAHWIAQVEDQRFRAAAALGASRVTLARHPVPETGRRWRCSTADSAGIVVPGFIKPHKGYDRLLAWLASRPGLALTLAGGPQHAADESFLFGLRSRAQAMGLTGRFAVTGYLETEAFAETLSRARLVVLPYERGGASGALSWAIAVGAPVVASDLPAFRELRDAGAGLELLPTSDAEAGPLLEALCADAGRLGALAQRNREYAAGHGYRDSASVLTAVIRQLAAGR